MMDFWYWDVGVLPTMHGILVDEYNQLFKYLPKILHACDFTSYH